MSLISEKIDSDNIELKIFGFEQVMDILSFVSPISLLHLYLKFPASDGQENIEKLLALDRWSEFENLKLEVPWHTVSEKELIFIKEILTTSRIFKCIRIQFEQLDEKKVKELFGQEIYENVRYVRVPNKKNQVLSTYVFENYIAVSWEQDKYTYDFLPATDEPFEVCNDWSETLENKTIIELLLDHLGFIEIQTLRKVCSNIRTCIDHFKPNPNLTKLGIWIRSKPDLMIGIDMGFMNGSYRETSYEKVKSGCKVGNIFLRNQDMHEICLNDLKTIMPRKEFHLKIFVFAVPCPRHSHVPDMFAQKKEFVEKLEKLLIPNNVLMKARKFMYFEDCNELYQMTVPILWLEPISLELIEIPSDRKCEWNMNEAMKFIMDTNQWQYAKEYMMNGFAFLGEVNPIHFVHFSKIDITVRNWTNEDFFNWQEEILYSPSFLRYKISLENCSIDNDIYNLLGLPYRTVNGRTTWYFKMPEKNRVLHVLYYTSKAVIFTRVDIEDVPEDVML